MKNIKKALTNLCKPNLHNLLVVLLILFIMMDTTVPNDVKHMLNNPIAKVVLLTGSLYLTVKKPLLGSLTLIALYELMTRGTGILDTTGESLEAVKDKIMANFEANQKKVTLEEQMVNGLVPYYNSHEEESTVEPILSNQITSSSDV
jgi:hypothetical protein